MKRGYHPLRVGAVVQETADTRSFVLDVPDELQDTFRYRAGQFCTFRVSIDGEEHMRCYSMSSAPETDGDVTLTVTVKRVPGGLVSNWLNDHVAKDDVLDVSPPAGVFCVRPGARPVVAYCGGSGVTPVISIAKSVLATTADRPVRVLYANRDRASVIFDDDLGALRDRHDGRLDLRHHLDADRGFLDPADITAFVLGDLDADFYICGPGPFMDLVEGTLLAAGVDPGRIAIERFNDPAAAAPDDAVDDAGPGADPDADATEVVQLILGGKRTSVAYQPGDTVLETARRGALRPPFSCEAGNCATCMAQLREGSATMRANTALTPEEVEDGWVLTCQALPHGRVVTVDYDAL